MDLEEFNGSPLDLCYRKAAIDRERLRSRYNYDVFTGFIDLGKILRFETTEQNKRGRDRATKS